jgi:hypothetical protein
VGADGCAFLDYANRELASRVARELAQTAGGGEAGGTRPDDDNVELHAFACLCQDNLPGRSSAAHCNIARSHLRSSIR